MAGCLTRLIRIWTWWGDRPAWSAILAGLLCVHAFFVSVGNYPNLLTIFGLTMVWRIARTSGRYRYGLLFGLAYFLPITHWLGVFVGRWTHSPVLYGLAWGFVALGLALPLATIVPISARLLKSKGRWAIPLVWIALELFRSYVPVLAFPWGLIAHPLANGKEIPALYGWLTEYGTGGLIVAFSIWIWSSGSTMARTEHVRTWRTYGAVVAFIVVLVGPEVARSRQEQPDLTLAAYGSGLDLAYGPYAEGSPGRSLAVRNRITASRAEQRRVKADLMVLPEGLISSSGRFDLPELSGDGTLLLGGQRRVEIDGKRFAYQTAFAFDGSNGAWESADKTRLVIFGEFVPGRGVIPYPPSFALPGGDLDAASELRVIDAHARDGRLFRIGPILCFEALFPDIAYRQKLKGAEVLAVMSLDDWFGGTKAPEWLELASRWRAAETRLPLVRVGSLGRTSIIDSHGKPQESLNWGEQGTISWNPAKE